MATYPDGGAASLFQGQDHGFEPWFTPFLRTERPDLLPLYRRLYPTGYAPRPYVERLRATVASLRADVDLSSAPPPLQPAREPVQLAFAR
jgi:hypothetical protein